MNKQKNALKKIIFAGVVSISTNLWAVESQPYKIKIHGKDDEVTIKFAANVKDPELGRAWLQINDRYDNADNPIGFSENVFDVKVDGLSYKSETGEIFYHDGNGHSVVCAKEVKKPIYKDTVTYESTGLCALNVKKANLDWDDGFKLSKSWSAVATLTVQGPESIGQTDMPQQSRAPAAPKSPRRMGTVR